MISRFSSEIVRTNKVLHNQDIMSIVGKYCVQDDQNRRSFISVCRLWRQVYYSRLASPLIKPKCITNFLLSNFCVDAFVLLIPRSQFDFRMAIILAQSSLSRENQWVDVLLFLRQVPSYRMNLISRMCREAIQMGEGKYFIDDMEKKFANIDIRFFRGIFYFVTFFNVHPRIKTYLASKLNSEQIDIIYQALLCQNLKYAPRIFGYVKIRPDHLRQFSIHTRCLSGGFSVEFEILCKAMIRDVTIGEYAKCYCDLEGGLADFQDNMDIFLRVGAEVENFHTELFSLAPHHRRERLVSRFIWLGLIDRCDTIRRKIVYVHLPKMTVFEYVGYIGDTQLLGSIQRDPKFQMRNHLTSIVFMIKYKPKKAPEFIKSLNLDVEELDLAHQIVTDAQKVSKKKDFSCFDLVLQELIERKHHLERREDSESRKRIKLDEF